MADKQTVKVGDKVRCLVTEFDVRKGELYEVLEVQDSGRVWFLDDVSDRFYLDVDEYELLPVAEATGKPAFKVGDRVVALKDSAYSIKKGSISTVVRVDGDHISIRKENGTFDGWRAEYFALAPSLTIETGKFYRTRDGRKVGPMVHATYGDWFYVRGDAGSWRHNGAVDDAYTERQFGSLIAEWVDEPASNDNQPVAEQQAGTVFIDASKAGPSQLHLAKGRLVKVNQGYGFELARYGDYVWVDTGKKQPVVAHVNEIKEAA
ncbi:hypothetical protein WKW50_19080 [Ochrobactrum sp. GPK 3]